MRKLLLPLLLMILIGCSKPAQSHVVRVITFAMDTSGQYVTPVNTAMYLNNTQCICFPDSVYGVNTNPTLNLMANPGDELHIVSFVNAGEPLQYKTIRVYVDNKIVYNVSNVIAVDAVVTLR
jgi:hypothetical protein